MIRNLTITKVLIGVIGLTLTSCSTWHYKNPRVAVDRDKIDYVQAETNSPTELASTPQENIKENVKFEFGAIANNKPGKPALSNTFDKKPVVVANTHTKTTFIQKFLDQVKQKTNSVNKAKDVEKTALSGWVRIMVILFVVGFILLLVGIFLSVFVFGPFWWLFYAFGALLILAGVIVLILGLVGLI